MRRSDKFSLTGDILACIGLAIFIFAIVLEVGLSRSWLMTGVAIAIIATAAYCKHQSIKIYKTSKEK